MAIEEMVSSDAWTLLAQQPDAVLIDVRTLAEWSFVGVPELSDIDKAAVLMEWQQYPSMAVAPNFAENLRAQLTQQGVGDDATLLFICRSGARSLSAALAVEAAGAERRLINVSDGFEGPLDQGGHRGSVAGWKAANLPWRQK